MNQGFNQNEFENFLKEHADEHRMYPADRVWKGIYRHVHLKSKWQLGILMLLFVSTVIAFKLQTNQPNYGNKIISNQLAAYHPAIGGWENLFSKTTVAYFIEQQLNNENTLIISADDQSKVQHAFGRNSILNINDYAEKPVLADNTTVEEAHPAIENTLPVTQTKVPAAVLFERENLTLEKATVVAVNPFRTVLPETQPVSASKELEKADIREIVKKNRKSRISWQLSAMPTTSFRKLSERPSTNHYILNNFPFVSNNPEKLVSHRPAVGLELGVHMLYKLNDQFRIRTGLQVNYSKYEINAYSTDEIEPVRIYLQGGERRTYYSFSNVRNIGGEKPETITNQYFQLAIPIGLEFTFLKRDKLSLTAAGSIQPNYLLNANSYLISTDFTNYAKAPELLRKFNASTSGEVFVSYEAGTTRWQIGPVVRYQLQSSFVKEYPIRERIIEYGFKIAVTNIIP